MLLQPGAAVKFYKRFDFNQLEEPKYLVASYWQGGEEHKAYFVLEELIDYPTLLARRRGEDVQAMAAMADRPWVIWTTLPTASFWAKDRGGGDRRAAGRRL